MASIEICHPHKTARDDAAKRTRKLLDDFAAKRGHLFKDMRWAADGTHADIIGKGFTGHVKIDDAHVTITLTLKLVARPFKGKVESSLDRRLTAEFGG